MVHSFYAGMGGFAFDLSSPDLANCGSFLPPDQHRLYLSPRGILLLAKCGLLPTTTLQDIKDKSKTDTSGKFICCIQVVWMLVQAVSRLAVGLPVTPLETNTIAHVFCALINYTLWWNKPRWIKEPTLLTGEWTRCMCAFMYMSGQVSAKNKVDRDLLRDFGVQAELSGLVYVSQENGPGCLRPYIPDHIDSTGSSDDSNVCAGIADQYIAKSRLPDGGLSIIQQKRWNLACEAIARFPAVRQRLELPPTSQKEASYREALRLYPEMPEKVSDHFKSQMKASTTSTLFDTTHRSKGLVITTEELVVERPKNWPGDDLLRQMQGHVMGIILWSSSTVYGAIHLAGWNEHFPSRIEQWFWRGSAAYLVFSGLLWSLLNLLGHVSGSVWWFWYNILAASKRSWIHIVLYISCGIGGSLYVVARIYLVLEAFLSLRALPASAYASPNWIVTVPHL